MNWLLDLFELEMQSHMTFYARAGLIFLSLLLFVMIFIVVHLLKATIRDLVDAIAFLFWERDIRQVHGASMKGTYLTKFGDAWLMMFERYDTRHWTYRNEYGWFKSAKESCVYLFSTKEQADNLWSPK